VTKAPVVPEDSPLRRPPPNLSRRQVLILDGLRYAAEMADVAYERLYLQLQDIARSTAEPTTREIAAAMLDAWSVVDSVHRFVDLANTMPGLAHGPWLRRVRQQCADALDLRDAVQHQAGEIARLLEKGGQVWGYLSWAATDEKGRYTGKWLMISPGADYVGDRWFFIGPATVPLRLRRGRIRLNAFDRRVYLSRSVLAVLEATAHIAAELDAGRVRSVGPPATERRGADSVMEGFLEVLRATVPQAEGEASRGRA